MSKYDRKRLLKKHPRFLRQQNYRCQCTGLLAGKTVNGKYHRYSFHHTSSSAYGREHCGWNYILLCPFAHWFVHNVLGGAWFSDRDVTVQNKRAKMFPCSWIFRYPNPPQRLFHFWCRTPRLIKGMLILWGLIELVWLLFSLL